VIAEKDGMIVVNANVARITEKEIFTVILDNQNLLQLHAPPQCKPVAFTCQEMMTQAEKATNKHYR